MSGPSRISRVAGGPHSTSGRRRTRRSAVLSRNAEASKQVVKSHARHADEPEHRCSSSDANVVDVFDDVECVEDANAGDVDDRVDTQLEHPGNSSFRPHTGLKQATTTLTTPIDIVDPCSSKRDATTPYLLTGIAVVASIMGRLSAQELRYDSARLFRNQESSRALSMELRRKRQEYKDQEEVRLAEEQKRRVVEVAEKARQEAERQKRVQKKYEKLARDEEARRRKELEASRKEYEEKQRKLDEEYQERLRKEQAALAEARRVEQEKRAREERERQEELERRERELLEREETERRARKEAAAARVQARQDAERMMTKFAVRLDGTVEVSVPPAGTSLPGPMQEEARFRLEARTGSLVGGPGVPCQRDFHLAADMAAAAPDIIASAAHSGVENVVSALQLQKMSGEGPLTLMEPPEVDNWMRSAVARTSLNGLAGLILTKTTTTKTTTRNFECRTESGVLPAEHPLSYQQAYAQLLDRIVQNPDSLETIALFKETATVSNEAFYKDLKPLDESQLLSVSQQSLGVCLFLAHFIDRSLYARPARESDAPAWFETCVEFCRKRLNEAFAGSPPDSLAPVSSLMSTILGESHPVAVELADMAERNTSEQTRLAAAERERSRKAALAAKLLEEEWPDEEDLRKARAKEREAKTPVTERIWALRNVASSLAIGNMGEVSRARQLLEQAVILKQDMCESKDHPAVFPEALMLLKVIRGPKDWKEDAAGVASLFLKIATNIAEGYERTEDFCSACMVLEMALKETEDAFVSLRNNATLRCVNKLEELSSRLSPDDNAILMKSRRDQERLENFLSNAFTDQLGAYQKDGLATRGKHELWNEDGAGMLGKLDLPG